MDQISGIFFISGRISNSVSGLTDIDLAGECVFGRISGIRMEIKFSIRTVSVQSILINRIFGILMDTKLGTLDRNGPDICLFLYPAGYLN